MTHATIAANVHQALNVQLNLRTEISLYFILCTNNLTNLGSLIICPVFYFQVSVNTSLIQYSS